MKTQKDGEHYIIRSLHNLFFSSDVVRMIKSRRMRSVNHVACMREMRNMCRISVARNM
jgi:hypothetical protein